MGGKRPDQHNIDPAEAARRDHKWRHEGRSGDEHLASEEKQQLQANPHDQPMIPQEGANPVAARAAGAKKVGVAGRDGRDD